MAESSKNSERDLLRLGYSLMASIVIVLCIICALVVCLWKEREMDVDVINMSSSVNASEMVDGNVRKVIDGKVVDVVLQKSTAESGIDIKGIQTAFLVHFHLLFTFQMAVSIRKC
eukprot:713589_1